MSLFQRTKDLLDPRHFRSLRGFPARGLRSSAESTDLGGASVAVEPDEQHDPWHVAEWDDVFWYAVADFDRIAPDLSSVAP